MELISLVQEVVRNQSKVMISFPVLWPLSNDNCEVGNGNSAISCPLDLFSSCSEAVASVKIIGLSHRESFFMQCGKINIF